MEAVHCMICGQEGAEQKMFAARDGEGPAIFCPRCGIYRLLDLAGKAEPSADVASRMYLLSAAIRRHSDSTGVPYHVTEPHLRASETFEMEVVPHPMPTVIDKGDEILRFMQFRSDHPGHWVEYRPSHDYTVAFCLNEEEAKFHVCSLLERGLIEERPGVSLRGKVGVLPPPNNYRITPKGWDRLAAIVRPSTSDQCFVAMWFADEMKPIFIEAIKPLEELTGWRMYRVDRDTFDGKICDRIIAEIRRSRFAIVDVTGHRNAVYFEAGFAMGLGIPVIWTCKKDGENDRKLADNFDTRQYPHILWENAADLRKQLQHRIEAVIGIRGSRTTPKETA